MIRMAKTETLHIRLEPELKSAVEETFRTLGLSAAEAINIFFHQVLLHDGLPFAVAAIAAPVALGIVISTLFTKQHVVIDALTALPLAAVCISIPIMGP